MGQQTRAASGTADPALLALSGAILAISGELSYERALQRMADAARELACARYAALGIPDGHGGFEEFITSGMSDALVAAIGPLPRTHGLLGAMLEDTAPFRTADIKHDPRFIGWPNAHPVMGSFMGVPIVSQGRDHRARSTSPTGRTPPSSRTMTSATSACSPRTPPSPSRTRACSSAAAS